MARRRRTTHWAPTCVGVTGENCGKLQVLSSFRRRLEPRGSKCGAISRPRPALRAADSQRGFTLIEVVVALVALSLAVAVVYESMGQGLRRSAVDRQREDAWLIAKSLLAEIRQAPALQSGVREGIAPRGLRWRYEILAERTTRVRDIDAFEVTIAVSWGARPAQQVQLRSIEIPGLRP